jgi:hypothetical protein
MVISSALKVEGDRRNPATLDFTKKEYTAAVQAALDLATLYYVKPLINNDKANKGQK